MFDYGDSALIGHTGFVGKSLAGSRTFGQTYNSTNLHEIVGKSFECVVCAAAPANMLLANRDPTADRDNLRRFQIALETVHARRLVLISTIAVFDDASAGYTERNARYEVAKAYGRHRRDLETWAADRFDLLHVIRLPALFGPGLKKNFIFDLINPVPSLIRSEKFESLRRDFWRPEIEVLESVYAYEDAIRMWRLDRRKLDQVGSRRVLEDALTRVGFVARNFTDSRSNFQYYDVTRLGVDIERAVQSYISLINVCSEPLNVADVALALTGETFANETGAVVNEDVRSEYAGDWGGPCPYLFPREQVLSDLKAFYRATVGV